MTSLVAYIERGESGLAIRAIRLVDARAESRWSAPLASTPLASPLSPTLPNPDDARAVIAAAADWLRDRLSQAGAPAGTLRLCLDLAGARCAWLTAPSLDHALVKAAAMDASAASSQTGGAGAAGGPGGGLGIAWAPEFGQVDADLTVEALNGIEAPPSNAPAPDRKRRLAVLAIPDAPARVLVDELDARGIEIAAVDSLWHALAAAWDPSAPANSAPRPRAGGARAEGDAAPVIDAADPITAVVLVDPAGSMAWCWSRGGHVLATGVQRLRTLEVARAAPLEPLVDDAGSTRRLLDPAQTEPARVAEVCRADAGRLVGEWLAWAAQLGVVPSRIVCIGPADAIATGLGDAPEPNASSDAGGLAALGRTLAARWPGAVASVVLDDDPIGATLRRLAEHRPPGVPTETTGATLRDLSSRPGRLSRAMHRWVALALLAAAGFVCVLALRLDRSAKATLAGAQQAIDKRLELLRAREADFPKLAADPDPVTKLKVALRDLQKNREETTPERPVLPVIDRVLAAASGIEHLKIKKITVSSLSGVSFDFVVPDPEPGAALLKALREDPRPILQGQSVQVIWEGDTATQTVPVAGMTEPQRVFKLRGIWFDPRAQRPGAPPGGAP